jgi:guanine deaminase
MTHDKCNTPADPERRSFLAQAAATATVAATVAARATPVRAELDTDRRKFMQEATRLATESVEKGWGGPFGAVIVKDGEIIGRGQNRVLLTGCPVFHAEVTAIIDASNRLNPKALLGSDYGPGTMLEMIPRPTGSPDLVPERARMLKGCDIYINGAPCPMCMSAIYWSRIDHLYFGASLEDTNHIGFSDAFQYEDFRLPWEQRKGIAVTPNFERDIALAAYRAWENKQDRHPY